MIANITVNSNYTTLLSAGAGVRLANVGMYFCNNSNRPNVISIYALSADAQPSKSNVLAYNISVPPSETFYFGQEKFILDEGERLVAKVGVGSMTSTMTFMGIGEAAYSSGATARAVPYNGGIVGVVVVNGGSGYTSAPSVSFIGGGGADAAATAQISASGEVDSIIITDEGSGYSAAPEVEIT